MTHIKQFQIVDIISDDLVLDRKKEFICTIYGIDAQNNRIVVHVKKFKPYFYIKIPNEWSQPDGYKLVKDICGIKPGQDTEYTIFDSIKAIQIDLAKDFYGLHWNEAVGNIQKFHFLKIYTNTHEVMKKLVLATKKHYNLKDSSNLSPKCKLRLDQWRSVTRTVDCDSNLYESSIHPIIKFIHDTKINPTGWISCKTSDDYKTGLFTSCKHEYTCSYKHITNIDSNEISSYKVAAFDIECDSSHGDFPQPNKNFKKLAQDVYDSYQAMLKNSSESERLKINKDLPQKLLLLIESGFTGIFQSTTAYKYANMNQVITTNNEQPSPEIYKNIIDEIVNLGLNNIIMDINSTNKERDKCINDIQDIIHGECQRINITVEGDPIIQIGTVFYDIGTGHFNRHIIVIAPQDNLDDQEICADLDNIIVQRCKSEKELLMAWAKIIREQDPDFVTGYNIFGFDFKYIGERAKILFPCLHKCNDYFHVKGCPYKDFMNFGKMNTQPFKAGEHKCKKCTMKEQKLSSNALGDNTLHYITMDGRILFDIQKEVHKGHNLESYKLDDVASHFMRGKIKSIRDKQLVVSSTGELKDGDFISFRTHTNIGEGLFEEGKKYQINTVSITSCSITLLESLDMNLELYHKVEWCLNKDDITPQDIFNKHKYGGPKGRAEVAKYCVQDCELCINLLLLLDIIPNNLGMANVSYVPVSYIFLRGQGVKITSVVSRMSSERNTRIPDLKKIPNIRDYIKMVKNGETKEAIVAKIIEDADWRKPHEWELEEWYKRIIQQAETGQDGYEGAVVLDPKPGIYLDDPIAVLDYASLYPSSIIEKNISHETYIENKDLLPIIGEGNYYTIKYQDWIYQGKGKGDSIEKIDAGTQTICHFLKPEYMIEHNMFDEGEKPIGIIPAVLDHLLSARKRTKELMKNEPDEFKKKVLDGLQLAYKVTANSVYGQLGARTSTIFKMNLAACTTSIGRSRIDDASLGVKLWAEKKGYPEPDVIYGDTDSVFVKFSREKNGLTLTGKDALKHCMLCGQEAGEFITKGIIRRETEDGEVMKEHHDKLLQWPQDLEYEKTFWPFILISKKRYTGDKYEFDINECKRDAMGIVLKRRDNSPIVKHVFGNVIEKIMIEKDFKSTLEWLKETLHQIRTEQFPLRYFVVTKALNGYYKNPQQIAHKVLADRMAFRDPGNKPKANDRIPYAYIKLPKEILYDCDNPYKSGIRKGKAREKKVMQGDRIEHVDYIKAHHKTIDYEFYITNQIMNPVKQVLDLQLDPETTALLFSNPLL
tara:strand:- start:344 stop:4171 length:3828 start_codon:yes stop_codon:yes gene_type:complete